MAKPLSEFEKAFAEARAKRLKEGGNETFDFKGTTYHSFREGEVPKKYQPKAKAETPARQVSPDEFISQAKPSVEAEAKPSSGPSHRYSARRVSYTKPSVNVVNGTATTRPWKGGRYEEMYEKVKTARGYAKGGSVRGDGCAVKGKTKGRMR